MRSDDFMTWISTYGWAIFIFFSAMLFLFHIANKSVDGYNFETPKCTDNIIKECYVNMGGLKGTKQTGCNNYHDYHYETYKTIGDTGMVCGKDWTKKYE